MSGQNDKDYNAQTEASIDLFESLGISPEQASYTNLLVLEALGNSDEEAYGCDFGLCCSASFDMEQQLYGWYCER